MSANDDVGDKMINITAESLSKLSLEKLTPEEKCNIALSVGEECITPEELLKAFQSGRSLIAYDGFEPSGRMHIAQGLLKSMNVNKLTACGVKFIFWVADWFALLNNKMNGELEKIKTVGQYMIEVWKAAGMNMENVEFVWTSEAILARPDEYWALVFDIARKNSLQRVTRCTQIMGRSENEDLSAAQIFYPVMQCADIFFLKADICQLGMDQRKVNVLAREYAKGNPKVNVPIVISHHMMMGLAEGQEKMSKSCPDSAIFMEDSVEDVNKKIKKAFCPPGIVDGNPILDYYKHLIFVKFDKVTIKRKSEDGGDVAYKTYTTFENDFKEEKLHPKDVKTTLADLINEMLSPVRDHFQTDPHAKSLLQKVRGFTVTR